MCTKVTRCESCKQQNEVLGEKDQYGWMHSVCKTEGCAQKNRVLLSRAHRSDQCGHTVIGYRQESYLSGRPPMLLYTCWDKGCAYHEFTQSVLWDEEAQRAMVFKAVAS
jgi:hypothetical protein